MPDAVLGMLVTIEGAENATAKLRDLRSEAAGTEQATGQIARGTTTASSAIRDMLQSIEANVRAQHEFTRGLMEGAVAAMREAEAAEQARAAAARLAEEKRKAAAAAAALTAQAAALKASVDPVAASIDRVNAELAQADALFKAGAISAGDYAQAQTVLNARLNALNATHAAGAKGARLQGHEVANLGRQFADLGVMAAMGMNPLMILISQGPQIADIFTTAKARGMGFGAVMKDIGTMALRAAPAIAAVGTVAAVAFGAAALAQREWKDESKAWLKEMNFSEDQLKRIKDQHVTMGDVAKATWRTMGDAVKALFGDQIDAMGNKISDFLDWLTKASQDAVWWTVEQFISAYNQITATWRLLPKAIGEAAINAANSTIQAIESMVNRAIEGINKLITMANNATAAARGLLGMPGIATMGGVAFGRIENTLAGSGAAARAATTDARERAAATTGNIRGRWNNRWGENLEDVLKERWKKEAGDARGGRSGGGKKDSGPSAEEMENRFQERMAELNKQIEAAKVAELQAQLALATSIEERAAIELKISRAQFDVQKAENAARREKIENDEKLTATAKAELTKQLEKLEAIQAETQGLKEKAIITERDKAVREREFEIAQRRRDADEYVLEQQLAVADSVVSQRLIEDQLWKIAVEKRKAEIEHLKASKDARDQAEAVAQERELEADIIRRRVEEERRNRGMEVYRQVESELGRIVDAFKNRDWASLWDAVSSAVRVLIDLRKNWGKMTSGEKIGAIAGVGQVVGQAVGGRVGGFISGAAGGAAAGSAFGPVGAVIGGIIGGISSLIGGNRQKKEEERARREAAEERARQVAAQRREIEIQLLVEEGDLLGAITKSRAAELEQIDPANRALAERLMLLKQEKEATAAYGQLFLSEEERLLTSANEIGQAFKKLGVAAPQTAQEFKALVDSIDRTTAAGQDMFSALMQLGPAFMQVIGYIQQVQGAAASMSAFTPYQAASARYSAAQARVQAAQAALQAALARETAANNAAAQAAAEVARRFGQLADNLERYGATLRGPGTGMLSPEAAYQQALTKFASLEGRTDETSLGQLQPASEALLEASKAYYGQSLGYMKDLERVRAAVDKGAGFARQQATAADRTVDALERANQRLQEQVNAALGIQEATISVEEAIKELEAAEAELAAAEEAYKAAQLGLLQGIIDAINGLGPALGGGGAGGADAQAQAYLSRYPDVLQGYVRESTRDEKSINHLKSLGINSAEDFARWHFETFGRSEGRQYARGTGFSSNGVSLVGERGPELIDLPGGTQVVPNEILRGVARNDNFEVVNELRELKVIVGDVVTELRVQTAHNAEMHQEVVAEQKAQRKEMSKLKDATRAAGAK